MPSRSPSQHRPNDKAGNAVDTVENRLDEIRGVCGREPVLSPALLGRRVGCGGGSPPSGTARGRAAL